MKTRLLALLMVSFLLAANSVQAETKVRLKVRLKPGAVYENTEVRNEKIEYEKNGETIRETKQIQSTSLWKVLELVNDSVFLVEYSYKSLKVKASGLADSIEWNADTPDKNNPLYNDFLHPVRMQLNSKGGVNRVEGMDALSSNADSRKTSSKLVKAMFDPENLKSMDFRYFPDKEIGVGDHWESSVKTPDFAGQEQVLSFVVTALDNDKVTLVCSSNIDLTMPKEKLSLKGAISDTMTFDITDCFSRTVQTSKNYTGTVTGFVDKNGDEIPIRSLKEKKMIVKRLQ